MQNKTKIASLFIAIVVITAIALTFAGRHINSQVNILALGLADKLSAKIGHKVKISRITTRGFWLNLHIYLQDIVILDKDSNIPLCMISEVVSTISPLESLLSMQLKFKHLLVRSPRMVLAWNGAKFPSIAGLDGGELNDTVDPVQFIKILAMHKSVAIEDGDFHIQGLDNTDVPLMNVKVDFRQQTQFVYSMLIRGSIAAATPPEFNLAVNYTGNTEDFNTYMLEFDLKTSNIQIENLLNLVPTFNQNYIQGSFADLDIKGAIQNNELRYLNSDFTIDNISFGGDTNIVNGAGRIEWQINNEWLHIGASDIQVSNKWLYKQDIKIDTIDGSIKPEFSSQQLKLTTKDFHIVTNGLEVTPTVEAHVADNMLVNLSLRATLKDAHVDRVKFLLPDQYLTESLTNWLDQSLTNGYVQDTNLDYYNGKIKWQIGFKDIELQYANKWPSIQGLDASLVLDDKKLYISASRAAILNNKVNNLIAIFNPVGNKPHAMLNIRGDLDCTLEEGLSFLLASPLSTTLGTKLEVIDPNGQMHLDLKLAMNLLDTNINVLTNGSLLVDHASIKIPETEVSLNKISGQINFSNDHVYADKIHVSLFDNPAIAKIAMHGDKVRSMRVSLATPLQISDLQSALPKLNLKHMSGKTDIDVKFDIPWDDENRAKILMVNSNLQGVALNFPKPFNKLANQKLPIQIKYIISQDLGSTVGLHLSDWFDATLNLSDGNLTGGHIVFGGSKATTTQQQQLFISGQLPHFDWDLWHEWLNKNSDVMSLPLVTNLLFNKLQFRGETYKNMRVKYESSTSKIGLDSPLIIGTIQRSKDDEKININLEKLDLGDAKLGDNVVIKTLHEQYENKQLALIQFYCENLIYQKKQYNKVNVQLLPRTYGYEITDFSAANDSILLQSQGQWQMQGKENTQLSGNIYTKDLGKVLRDWKYGSSVSKGNGELNFSLQWAGDPTKLSLEKLDGDAHVDLHDGVINSIKPGLRRIIGLLSMDSLQRRFKLDFSDIMNKGFVFDRLVTDLELKPGTMSAEKITINSPSARIEISGKSDISTHELDLVMFVTPKLGVGIPVAAAVAVANPVVGAALWAFDLAASSVLSELSTYKYRVTGTWEAPHMSPLESKTDTEPLEPKKD